MEFCVPAVVASDNPHKDSLCRISHLSDGSIVSCSQVSGVFRCVVCACVLCVCMCVCVCVCLCVVCIHR